MLNPEFWLDEKLATLSAHARLLYQGLWGICDDNYATLPNRSAWIKAQIFPYEIVDIEELLTELSESGHILLFTDEKHEEYWYIKNFFKYQRVERPSKPKYPQFKENLRVLTEPSVNTPAEVKLSKDKRREDNIGDAQEFYSESITEDERKESRIRNTQLSSILDKRAKELGLEKKSPIGITKEWQDRAFREMEYIGVELKKEDVGRVFKVYKEESEGKKLKASTSRVIAYLKDYPRPLAYDGKLNMFFKLVSNGFTINPSGD